MVEEILRWYDYALFFTALLVFFLSKHPIWRPISGFFVVFMVAFYLSEVIPQNHHRNIYKLPKLKLFVN